MITEFTPWASLAGGVLIGLSAVMLMAFSGRIAGMTGILAGLLPPYGVETGWKASFLIGAMLAPVALLQSGYAITFDVPVPATALILGGLIVGAGVAFANGCTSGHGICGIARLSPRSLVATAVFMASGFVTVFVIRHLIGGWS